MKTYRKVLSLFLAVMMVMTLCACSSGGSSAAGSAGGGETTSAAVEETETAEETTAESAGAVGELGLTEEQQEEMFAYTAYYVNEYCLKPYDFDAQTVWDDADTSDMGWDLAYFLLDNLSEGASEGELELSSGYEEFVEEKEDELAADAGFAPLTYTVEGIFGYCHSVGTYPDFGDVLVTVDDFRSLIAENVTFSDEQLALGEEAAEKVAVAVGADSEITASDLGLTDDQAEEMYAYIAYFMNENYLASNGIEAQSTVWDGTEINEVNGRDYWEVVLFLLGLCLNDVSDGDDIIEVYSGGWVEFVESHSGVSEREKTFEVYLTEGMFGYYYSIGTYPDIGASSDDRDFSTTAFKNLITENVTFSDEQLALGAEVAEKVNAASAE